MTLSALYDTLRPLRFTTLRVKYRLGAPLTVPRAAGSALRGALGWGLGRALSEGVYRRPAAHVLGDGPFERLWEPRLSSEVAPKLNMASHSRATPPYVVSAPGPQEYAEGALFTFALVLVGAAAQTLPLWVAACERVARHQRLFRTGERPGGVPAQLVEVRDLDGRVLFDGAERAFTSGFYRHGARHVRAADALAGGAPSDLPGAPCTLRLRFRAPTQLSRRKAERERLRRTGAKRGERADYIDRFRPEHLGVLVERLYYRLFVLAQLYCAEAPVQPYPGRAALPKLPDAEVARQDASFDAVTLSRQGQAQSLGALTGTVTFAGPLAPLASLFELGAHLHIGKSTSAGFGRFSVSVEEFSGGDAP